jgi:outer membrane protein assembly factor BamD (BamD/ComL family)
VPFSTSYWIRYSDMTRLKQILDDLAKGYITLLPYSAIVTIGLVLAIGIAIFGWWLFSQSDSEVEKEASNSAIESILSESNSNITDQNAANKQAESNRARDNATDAGKVSQNAQDDAEKAHHADSSKGKDRDAQERFCKRFPNDSTCRK